MKKFNLILTAWWLTAFAAKAGASGPVSLANPLQGTDSEFRYSHGNEYPAIALPFPMNTWAPYTQPERDSFYYQYRHPRLRGIRQTHQPSPWITITRRLPSCPSRASSRSRRMSAPPRSATRTKKPNPLLPRAFGHLESRGRSHSDRARRAFPVHLRDR